MAHSKNTPHPPVSVNITFLTAYNKINVDVSSEISILPVCLSRACLNWLIGGGTFNLFNRTAFCL